MCIVGARPNFMKVAPILAAAAAHGGVESLLIHTGQHYDEKMSGSFFTDLGMPKPDTNLEIGSGSHAEQTARIMLAFEPVLSAQAPDVLLVVGDVNSTLACALVAKKKGIAVAHVEAGLRSGDMEMPEEINRLCVDAISDYLFTTDRLADENLAREGVNGTRVHFVGNVMIDTLLRHLDTAREKRMAQSMGFEPKGYATLTLHRPSNVDRRETLEAILETVIARTGELPIVWPMHPRTRAKIAEHRLQPLFDRHTDRFTIIEPLGYLEFLGLNADARMVLTDSGGLQEETTILGVPCVTIRENTERPITITEGTNILASTKPEVLSRSIKLALACVGSEPRSPERWDGRAAERIVSILMNIYGNR